MTDVPYPDDLVRLIGNIRTELKAQLGMAEIEVPSALVDRLASNIAANIDYAFHFEWRPRWVKGDEPHRWHDTSESGDERYFVECLRCKVITVHATADDRTAWYTNHADGHA